MQQEEPNKYVKELTQEKYKYGFTTDVHTDIIERGLNEDVVRLISEKKGEPEWLLEFRLKAYRHWLTLEMPTWAHLRIPEIDYQAISYYADPTKKKEGPKSMDEVDPELIKTFNKLGIPLEEQMALSGMAVDAVMDSVSVKTTFKETLMEKGIIFCSFSEAVREHPDLVQKYLGSVVPYRDNFFAALNSAVFSDGSFVYIPKGVRCPMELSTYFRINARNTGQFERTLIVADDDSYVSYLEGCTAPMRDENQLHAAIVEIVVHDRAEVKYSTVQNWYPGDAEGRGGVSSLNLLTKKFRCTSDHQTADEYGNDQECIVVHETYTDTTEPCIDLHVQHLDHTGKRHCTVVHTVNGAIRSDSRSHRPQSGCTRTQTGFLTFHSTARLVNTHLVNFRITCHLIVNVTEYS